MAPDSALPFQPPGRTLENVEEKHPFKGRTVAIVNDLKVKEQWYLYQKTRELKEAVRSGKDLMEYRIGDPESAVYTIFMEDSTRTKESFRNAAEFHGMKVNVFDAKTSSFQKNETITDTIKMLCNYSVGQSIFVIRSKLEGVCTWLQEAIGEYTLERGFPRSSFINAGDGRHEHPSQEFLDEFSFLEQKGWDTSSIHIALLGDLFHGRTVHSKVDGLKLYRKVEVDLVAPAELALPKMYEDRMVATGFRVRKFSSIEEYLSQEKVAKLWYFTRLQLERMGDKVLAKTAELRQAVTMQRDFVARLPPQTKFFHPLPRDARHPTLPFWLDHTDLNGWDQQSQNGYFTRIVLLGMLGGLFGDDFEGDDNDDTSDASSPRMACGGSSGGQFPIEVAWDFVEEMPIVSDAPESGSEQVGLVPITCGMVIRDLAEGQSTEKIWGVMYMVRAVLGLTNVGGQGVHQSPVKPGHLSGFITVPDFDISQWDRQPLKKLAAMAPGSTVQMIREGRVAREFKLQVPPRIYNFQDISCKNMACVSHSANNQHEVPPSFHRIASSQQSLTGSTTWAFSCKYCEAFHDFWQIWDYKYYENSYAL